MNQLLPLHLDLIPLDLAWADPTANLLLMRAAIETRLQQKPTLPREARIFVFPELTLTGFVCKESATSALSRDSAEVNTARSLAQEFGVALLFGFPEKIAGQSKPRNTVIFVSPEGEDLAAYQKQHLFTVGDPSESSTYEHGTRGTLLEYRGWKIGLAICFDLRFPRMFHAYGTKRADLLILPACWVGGPGKSHQLRTLAAARAIEQQCFFAALNRSGVDPHFSYEGEVLCYGPKGETLAEQNGFTLDPSLLAEASKLQIRPSHRPDYLA